MAVKKLYTKTPDHQVLLDSRETVLSHNKVTGWSVNVPIAKTCQPSKVCIETCYFSKGGTAWPASLNKQVRVYNSIKADPIGTAQRIVNECTKNKATYLRWNGGGDLFEESILCLSEVARLKPETPIWVVTRIPKMAAGVPDIKNVFVHFSLDKHSLDRRDKAISLNPKNNKLFFSYQCEKNEEPPADISKLVSVIFWDSYKMKTVPKWNKTALETICPLNWRRFEGKDICGTCESCRRCFDNSASKHAEKVTGLTRSN